MILSGSTWEAAAALASELAGVETFRRYAGSLRLADGPVEPGPGFLSDLVRVNTGGLGRWESHLWMLGYRVSGDPMWNLEGTKQGREFVANAIEVSKSAALLFAWFRVRLPTYPYPEVPQLADGTYFTTPEFTSQIRWLPRAQTSSLQFVDFPNQIPIALAADDGQARTLRRAAVALLHQFEEEPVVLRHLELRDALGADDIAELCACSARLTTALTSIDDHESRFAIPRHQFRETMTREAVAELRGPALDYASSFDDLARALSMCLATVVPLLAVYGKPPKIGPLSDLSLDGSDRLSLDATVTPTPATPFVRVGRVYDARDSGFDDPLFVTGQSMNFSATSGTIDSVHGEFLEGAHVLLP